MSMLTRVARGSAWAMLGSNGLAAASLVTSIVVARLLGPEEIGRYALASAIVVLLGAATSLQSGGYYIVTDDPSPTLLRSGVTLEFTLGTIAFILLAFGSIASGAITGDHGMTALLLVSGLVLVTNPFNAIRGFYERDIQYRVQSFVTIGAAVLGLAVKLVLVALGVGALGLAIGDVAYSAAYSAAMLILVPEGRGLSFDRDARRRQLSFGVPALMTGVLSAASRRIPDLLIGAILGNRALGIYFLAARVPEQLTQVARTLSISLLPAFSRASGERLARGFQLATRFSAALCVIPLAVAIPFSEEIVIGVWGEQWRSAAVPLTLLTAAFSIRFVLVHALSLLKSRERVREITLMVAVQLVLSVVATVITASLWGLEAVCMALIAVELVLVPWKIWRVRTIVPFPTGSTFAPPLAALAAATGVGFMASSTLPGGAALTLAVAASAVMVGVATWHTDREVLVRLAGALWPRSPVGRDRKA